MEENWRKWSPLFLIIYHLLLTSFSIVAFALCFHVLSSDHEHFSDPLTSFMCTLAMMVGEFNFGDLFVKSEVTNNGTTQIMFVLFLVLVSEVILAYLLCGHFNLPTSSEVFLTYL